MCIIYDVDVARTRFNNHQKTSLLEMYNNMTSGNCEYKTSVGHFLSESMSNRQLECFRCIQKKNESTKS